jgi:hypothetical protein
LHIDKAKAAADIVAQYYNVGPQKGPICWAVIVIEFKAVWAVEELDVEDERLVEVPQEGNARFAVMAGISLAYPPTKVLETIWKTQRQYLRKEGRLPHLVVT